MMALTLHRQAPAVQDQIVGSKSMLPITSRARSMSWGVGYRGSLSPLLLAYPLNSSASALRLSWLRPASTANVLVPASLINVISTYLDQSFSSISSINPRRNSRISSSPSRSATWNIKLNSVTWHKSSGVVAEINHERTSTVFSTPICKQCQSNP